MHKIMVVFGTRPEAIKMCPVVKELKKQSEIKTVVCVTGQHKQMLEQVLQVFEIVPEYDLSIMKEGQTLYEITVNIMEKMKGVLEIEKPELVLVHGDTSTTFVTALSCYYAKVAVGHVEAGLRTNNIYSPFPEEFNRQAVSLISSFNFAPTERARNNLLHEGKRSDSIFVTGNTVIDALQETVKRDYSHPVIEWAEGSRLILLTAHRRENLGEPMRGMFRAIKRIVEEYQDIKVVYPVHMNPLVRDTASEVFSDEPRIRLIEPLDVIDFHNLMARCFLVLTDSGGIQEEAPSLGVPVLVMRNTTERPEGLESGTLKLVGTEEEKIYQETKKLIENRTAYEEMAQAKNPYGDGHASEKIVAILRDYFSKL